MEMTVGNGNISKHDNNEQCCLCLLDDAERICRSDYICRKGLYTFSVHIAYKRGSFIDKICNRSVLHGKIR